MNNKDHIAWIIENVFSNAINKEKQLNRLLVLVDTDSEKEEIMSCINSTLKEKIPEHTIHVFRIDLATIKSMNELSYAVFRKIYESQDDTTRETTEFSQWIEQVKTAEIWNDERRADFDDSRRNVNYGYGLFIFDNLDKANDHVLNGVQVMYHDGRHCDIPLGWEFISFCRHGAKINDPSFAVSIMLVDFNES